MLIGGACASLRFLSCHSDSSQLTIENPKQQATIAATVQTVSRLLIQVHKHVAVLDTGAMKARAAKHSGRPRTARTGYRGKRRLQRSFSKTAICGIAGAGMDLASQQISGKSKLLCRKGIPRIFSYEISAEELSRLRTEKSTKAPRSSAERKGWRVAGRLRRPARIAAGTSPDATVTTVVVRDWIRG